MVSVCPDESGIAVARMRRNRDSTPNLELCEIHETSNLSLQGAEIARLSKRHHLDRQACVSILDLGTYSMLMVEAPEVPQEEMQAAIRWRIKDLIDFDIEDAVVDTFEIPNQKVPGKGMLNVVVGRSDTVRNRIELLRDAGLELRIIDIPEMAMRNIAVLLPEDVAGMALLYLGRRAGLITITRQETLYLSRRIEVGYESFATDVERGDDDRIQQRLDNIVVEVQRSMDYYESNFSQPALSNIVIAPLSRPIPGIENRIQTQLGINCRRMDMNTLIDMDEPLDDDTQGRCFLAIGAALRTEASN
ncbi:MAG: pilus assembly protein PilM [Thiotrichales bacterium]|nr:pilus assembly protein PilM [Thiotrichales bacterium]